MYIGASWIIIILLFKLQTGVPGAHFYLLWPVSGNSVSALDNKELSTQERGKCPLAITTLFLCKSEVNIPVEESDI